MPRLTLRSRPTIYVLAILVGAVAGAGALLFEYGAAWVVRIALVGEDVGGVSARRVEFRPALGLARCRHVTDTAAPMPRVIRPAPPPPPAATGDVEFF